MSAAQNKAPIRLWFTGDGPRDHATLPLLVSTLLGRTCEVSGSSAWQNLHLSGSGYRRKLKFALRQAVDAQAHGLVAAIDQDNAPARARLRELIAGRDEARQSPGSPTSILPAALGEARPHGEAWLLDDAIAVREALQLAAQVAVPAVTSVESAKVALGELMALCEDEPAEGHLAAIAGRVQLARSRHAKDTGHHDFAEDVRRELESVS